MSASLAIAREDLLARVYGAWPGGVRLFVDGKPVTERPDPAAPWGEVVIRHVDSRQTAISLNPKFESRGSLIVSVYGTSRPQAQTMAEGVRAALEKHTTPGGLWFPTVRVRRIGPDAAWDHWNVSAEFRWTERAA